MSRKSRLRNKQNAAHSTGPITEAGKAASSQNSFRHGLSASAVIMVNGENVQDYIDLGNSLREEHKPVTITEDALVTKLLLSLWLSARAANLQQALFLDTPAPDPKLLALYIRYQSMHDRAFYRALDELKSLRKEAREEKSGFVLQAEKIALNQAKIRKLDRVSPAPRTHLQAPVTVVESVSPHQAPPIAAAKESKLG